VNREVPRVHAVTNQAVAALPQLETIAKALAISPRVALHARLPGGDGARILELAQRLAHGRGETIFVNDRVDVALVARAKGVHLPANGLSTTAARKLLAPGQILGRSAHSPDEARKAFDEGADYVFLGPIWETSSHPGQRPLGLDAFRGFSSLCVVAIGGVTVERATECRDAGAWGVAAITALWKAKDPGAAARAMLLSFEAT
jgi:thiamine-phosphate pyrophosphorylase